MIELWFLDKCFIYSSLIFFYYAPLSKFYSAIAYFTVADKGKEETAEWPAIERTTLNFCMGIYLYPCSYFDVNIVVSYVLM